MRRKNNTPLQLTDQSWDDHLVPIVSVFNWVYNHKDYIRDSIESILFQKTNFPVEIIIHDDDSNDGTREIILEYETKYPKLFRNILQSENQFSQGKSVMNPLFEKPRGKYISLTHGDDYWTDPYKLQKQVDFLEVNEGFSFVFSPATQFFEHTGKSVIRNKYSSREIGKIDLAWVLKKGGGFYPTATALFNRNIIDPIPPWFYMHCTGDYPIAVSAILNGEIGYIDDIMVTYRVHGKSLTNNTTIEPGKCIKIAKQNEIKNLHFFDSLFTHNVIDSAMVHYLKIKEIYTFYSKCINCKNYKKAIGGLVSPDLNMYFRIRLLAKLIWSVNSLLKN